VVTSLSPLGASVTVTASAPRLVGADAVAIIFPFDSVTSDGEFGRIPIVPEQATEEPWTKMSEKMAITENVL
jgi:ribulose 1,5-bisphosphate carboxylase large subunit-like protein